MDGYGECADARLLITMKDMPCTGMFASLARAGMASRTILRLSNGPFRMGRVPAPRPTAVPNHLLLCIFHVCAVPNSSWQIPCVILHCYMVQYAFDG